MVVTRKVSLHSSAGKHSHLTSNISLMIYPVFSNTGAANCTDVSLSWCACMANGPSGHILVLNRVERLDVPLASTPVPRSAITIRLSMEANTSHAKFLLGVCGVLAGGIFITTA